MLITERTTPPRLAPVPEMMLSWEIKNELKIFYVKKMEDVLMIAIGGEDDDY